MTLVEAFAGSAEQVTESLLSFIGKRSLLVLHLSENERTSIKIISSKLYYRLILCPGIATAAIVLTWFISPQVAQAAGGDLDPTFGTGGMVMTDINRSTDIANAVAVQADGKLVVVGQTYKNNDYSGEDFVVTRYNTDGTLDTTFGRRGQSANRFPRPGGGTLLGGYTT